MLVDSTKVHTRVRDSGSAPESSSSTESSSGSPGAGLPAACQAALLPALRACNGSSVGGEPGSECCEAVEAVGQGCLEQVEGALPPGALSSGL